MDDSMRCRGMRDILPAEMRRFRTIETAFREVCEGWGYEEVRTPAIEHLHLFTSAGTLSPQTLDHVYSFLDWDGWSGERVVLRPDCTIPAARLFVESMRDRRSAKLFYIQDVFRFAQGDEPREDYQCGVELIGDTQPEGDVELVLIAAEILRRLGFQPELRLSDPGILRAVLARAGFDLPQQLALYDRILDGDLSALDEIQDRLPETGVSLRGILSAEGEGPAYLMNIGSALLPFIPELEKPLKELGGVAEVLTRMGIAPRISPALVRKFEYYTGPVFHFMVADRKVGGGGRYDGLISLVGDEHVPASGFALSMSAMSELLAPAAADLHASVAIRSETSDPADVASAFRLASALRHSGWAVRLAGGSSQEAVWRISATSRMFSLTQNGSQPRRFDSVEGVITALAEVSD